jgi:hypothetical protein
MPSPPLHYEQIDPTLRAFLGTFEVFRRLGYSSDDLFCLISRSARAGGRLSCFLWLKTRDGKEFTVEVGPITSWHPKDFEDEYKRVSQAWNEGAVSEEDRERILLDSEAYKHSVLLLQSLAAKGFVPPKIEKV